MPINQQRIPGWVQYQGEQPLSFQPSQGGVESANMDQRFIMPQGAPQTNPGALPGVFRKVHDQTAQAINEVGQIAERFYARLQQQREQDENTEVISEISKIQRDNLQWQAEYRNTHTGQSALEAHKDYAAHNDELFDGLMNSKKWKGNARVQALLKEKKQEYGNGAFASGIAYSQQQRGTWYGDELAKAENAIFDVAASGDQGAVRQAFGNYAALWRNQNPGRDASPELQRVGMKTAQNIIQTRLASGDINGAMQAYGTFSGMLPEGAMAHFGPMMQAAFVQQINAAAELGDMDKVNRLARQADMFTPAPSGPTKPYSGGVSADYQGIVYKGKGTTIGLNKGGEMPLTALCAKYESGTQGIGHVSYGLQSTDGVDVGIYSHITKGKDGGSVGEMIRWAGKNGGAVGKELLDTFTQITGGNWDNLNNVALWKSGGAQKAWERLCEEHPQEMLKIQTDFQTGVEGGRFQAAFKRLSPQVQKLINSDESGVLKAAAFSCIDQHAQAISILNRAYDPDPKKFLYNQYKIRSDPARFKDKPSIGVRRFFGQDLNGKKVSSGGEYYDAAACYDAYYAQRQQGSATQKPVQQPQGEPIPKAQAQQTAPEGVPQKGPNPAPFTAGDMPPVVSSNPFIAAAVQNAQSRAEKRQLEIFATNESKNLLDGVSTLPADQQEQVLMLQLDSYTPEQRDAMLPIISRQVKWGKAKAAAEENQNFAEAADLVFNKTAPDQQATAIEAMRQSGKISAGVADKLNATLKDNTEKETPAKTEYANSLYTQIDTLRAQGRDVDTEVSNLLNGAFASRKITLNQLEKLRAYSAKGGFWAGADNQSLSKIYNGLLGNTGKNAKPIDEDLARQVRAHLKPGQAPTDEELKKIMVRLMTPGTTPRKWLPWDKSTTLWEATKEGKQELFQVEIPEEELSRLKEAMRAAGVDPENETAQKIFYRDQYARQF